MITRTVTTALLILCWQGANALLTHHPGSPAFAAAPQSVFDELYRDAALEITIKTDLALLLENLRSEEYQPGQLTYENSGGTPVTRSVEIRLRGKYRRRVCDFPPLKLKFEKAALAADGLNAEYNKMKLVTHCLDEKLSGNENVLREYLAYKLYHLITDKSYRVQLVKITYVDNKGKSGKVRRYGFLIEESDEMASRLGGEECEDCMNPDPATVDSKDAAVLALFQFMIGNADWSIPMLRNLKLVRRPGAADVIVPYDFDFSGMVNASYALPNTDHQLTKIRQRVYLGYPPDDPVLIWAINYFKFKEDLLFKEIQKMNLISPEGREDIRQYVASFFDLLDKIPVRSASDLYVQYFKEKIYDYAQGMAGSLGQ